MKSENRSQAFLRKRKMMLVMPLLVIPFLTMAFWALGGGSGTQTVRAANSQRLNLNLPSSQLNDDNADTKLSFYDKAQRDEAKMEEWMRNDPYYKGRADTNKHNAPDELQKMTAQTAAKFNQHLNASPYEAGSAPPEQKLMQKLAVLQKELEKPSNTTKVAGQEKPNDAATASEQMDRLESMMGNMQRSDGEDPEMAQIGSTLDKILDIQHPERVKERLKEKKDNQSTQSFPVKKTANDETISLFGFQEKDGNERFYPSVKNIADTIGSDAFEAEIPNNQTIVNGSIVRFRLLQTVSINGRRLPAGTFANGVASLNNERLEVEINSIRSGNSIILVKLVVYDLDGLSGLYVPGAISRDVAKQSVDNSMQLFEMSSMDPSLKAQLATAGISSVKNLLGRKVKQVKIAVKAGYKVLLKNVSSSQ
jgi:conjugative transposon TraM protein